MLADSYIIVGYQRYPTTTQRKPSIKRDIFLSASIASSFQPESQNVQQPATRQVTPPPSAKKSRVIPPSPNAADIRDALLHQDGSNLGGRQLTEVSSFQLLTYSIRKLDLQDLIKVSVQPPVPVSFEGDFSVNSDLGYYESPRRLQVTTRLRDPKKGVFKLAYAAHSNLPLGASSNVHGDRYPVYLKQVYKRDHTGIDVTLPNANQLRDLSMEGRTLAFGHSLWQLVDNYTDKALFKKGYTRDTAPISIPSFRYVDAALANDLRPQH
ncbi:hypothetical protein C8J56DRAFT_1065095 [Mycena floridula]|nr:hypothetical protein C8J56DRAFT_1065095 [Mycena floridula]